MFHANNVPQESDADFASQMDETQSSTSFLLAEGNLMRQRCAHFCCDDLLRKFRRLIKLDNAELFYSSELRLRDIENEAVCMG